MLGRDRLVEVFPDRTGRPFETHGARLPGAPGQAWQPEALEVLEVGPATVKSANKRRNIGVSIESKEVVYTTRILLKLKLSWSWVKLKLSWS